MKNKTKTETLAPSGIEGIPKIEPAPITLNAEEMKEIRDALWAARSDIWQTLRVNERNLSGIDPVFPHDEPSKPETPSLVHRRGLDESYLVHKQICEAQKMLAAKRQD